MASSDISLISNIPMISGISMISTIPTVSASIPTSSLYPSQFDSDTNLYVVHDSLRLRLAEDYNPGDTSIHVDADSLAIANWPNSGLLTLTEQCSDVDKRAISFFYDTIDKTNFVISGLVVLPGFHDVPKPKGITNVTMNVMRDHHKNIKEAVKAIQGFCGVQGTIDTQPFGPTLEGRINFLRQLVLQPKAWFSANVRKGNVPLEIEFNDMSFRLGTDGTSGPVEITWDFGDHTSSTISLTSIISATSVVPATPVDVLVREVGTTTIKKVYYKPGIYDVKLTVSNDFGSDTCLFQDFINARVKAPDDAVVRYVENTSTQIGQQGVPPNGPFVTPPVIRSPINTLIQIEVDDGENPATPGISYAGETLNESGNPIDPVINWTWALGDDLTHPNSRQTKASYSVGGIYDMKLRVDTQFGAYRITTYNNSIDIVENQNLWLWVFSDTNDARAYEYGLISESFKLTGAPTVAVARNDSFLTGLPNESQQKAEFSKNTGFAPQSTIPSGQGGTTVLYWASGRNPGDPPSSETIDMVEFDGFSQTYVNLPSIQRQWNWANLNSVQNSYFVFGTVPSYPSGTSPTNLTVQNLSFNNFTLSSSTLTTSNLTNGAVELAQNPALYDSNNNSIYGNYSVYRTTWKDSTGYILRNDGVGPFFRIKSFYRTMGTLGATFTSIQKLQDIQGPTKLEGELVTMDTGLYFLNNSGSVSKFDPVASVWTSGGPGVNSLLYRSLQDTSVIGFDSQSNTLLATSDSSSRAYMSFDYSPNAFLKFNEIDLTFVNLGQRPSGTQWIMGVY